MHLIGRLCINALLMHGLHPSSLLIFWTSLSPMNALRLVDTEESFYIRSQWNKKLLDVDGTTAGSRVQMYRLRSIKGNPGQRWRREETTEAGWYHIVSDLNQSLVSHLFYLSCYQHLVLPHSVACLRRQARKFLMHYVQLPQM